MSARLLQGSAVLQVHIHTPQLTKGVFEHWKGGVLRGVQAINVEDVAVRL
jgi:hypothetical protein